jgi:hypothetical protein
MLAEALQFLATPSPTWARKQGLLADSVALWSRGRRCRAAWSPHEARSRAVFERAIDRCARRRRVVVLGSGLLRDVPIDRLRRTFQEVVLVDAVHLAGVRLRAMIGRWDNVRFETRDLSGFDLLIERIRVGLTLDGAEIGARLDPLGFLRRDRDLDLVLSANILSQLAIGAGRRLSAAIPGDRIAPSDAVARVVTAHIEGLASVSCAAALVSDHRYERRDREGRVLESVDLMGGASLPIPDEVWDWTVAPFGEESRDSERVHRVMAVDEVAFELG